MFRLPLPLTFKAPKGFFKYAEYQRGDANAFFGPHGLRMLDGHSDTAREWDFPDAIVTYGLGQEARDYLAQHSIPFSLERLDIADDTGSIMFIHLPDEATARAFSTAFNL